MKLTLTCWLASLVAASTAFVPDIESKPPAIRETTTKTNAPLTPDERRQLFRLDEALERVRRPRTTPRPLTHQDWANLWRLDEPSHARLSFNDDDEASIQGQPYTFQDRAQLWHLDTTRPSCVAWPSRMSSQDYANLFQRNNQQGRQGETQLEDHAPYTATDRAALWRANHDPHKRQTMPRRPKWNLLSPQDRARLWHLDSDDTKRQADPTLATKEEPYTPQDRELLWHLEDHGKTLQDETKRQIYSHQDRAHLWHLDDETQKVHKDPASSLYTDQDRADLWHLTEHKNAQKDESTKDHAPYTAEDRQELWHL